MGLHRDALRGVARTADGDAFPCASFRVAAPELSPALERYDVMATHSSMRRGYALALHWLNAGVIAFNGHHRTRQSVLTLATDIRSPKGADDGPAALQRSSTPF